MGYDKDFVEQMTKNQLKLEDTFEFECLTDCKGKCCHRDDLILSGFDIYRIAKYQGKTMEQVITQNCEGYIGSDSKLPIISVKPRIGDNSCKFLRKGRCEVNQVKPISCHLFPLGRYLDSRTGEYIYFLQSVNCGGRKKQVVKDWIGKGIESIDKACKAWGSAIIELSLYVLGIKEKEKLKVAQQAILIALYFNIDVNEPFEVELQKNLKQLETVLPGFRVKH